MRQSRKGQYNALVLGDVALIRGETTE